MAYYVYILSNSNDSVLYIGVTNGLIRRISEHKQGIVEGFTSKYQVKKLVYYESFSSVKESIEREKILKKWRRKRKDDLVEKNNPNWNDLYEEIMP